MKRDYDEVLSEYGVATYDECISNNKPATTDREELKPCPFCGSATEDGMGYNYHKVCCSNLACRMSDMYFTRKEWNTRAKAQAVSEDNKELLQSLRDMVEVVGANFCSSQDVKRKYKIARELLEQNK